MLHRERELRLSDEYVSKFTATHEGPHDTKLKVDTKEWIDIVGEELQPRVVSEFYSRLTGSSPVAVLPRAILDRVLFALRSAHHLYPDDPEFKSIPIHVKFNRARQGHLQVGDVAPQVALHHLDGSPAHFGNFDRPLVIAAGSLT